jgi:alpha-amylase
VDTEKGNYDYLMGCDLNMNHPEVSGELKHWGKWMLNSIGIESFRLDALKHIDGNFCIDWISDRETHCGHKLFVAANTGATTWPASTGISAKPLAICHCLTPPLHLNSVSAWVEAAAWGPFLALSTRACLVASVSTSLPLCRR